MENDEPKQLNLGQALSALATAITNISQRTAELEASRADHTTSIEAMANAIELTTRNHAHAFQRIGKLLAGLGADFEGVELGELDSLFNKPSPPEGK